MHDLDDHFLVDDHPFHGGALVGDQPQIGGAIALPTGNAPVAYSGAQRREQRATRHRRLGDLQRPPVGIGLIEDRLEVIGRARIGRGADISSGARLLLGLPGAGRQNLRSNRARAAFKHQTRRVR